MLTHEWFFSDVSSFVDLKTASSAISLAAAWEITDIGLIAGVDQLVCFQVTFCDKALITALKLTSKGSLTGMNSQMRLQIACLLKVTQA